LGVHVPSFVAPSFAEHAEQAEVHALSQQTPSTQVSPGHWAASLHAAPLGRSSLQRFEPASQ
jgi:hypothetical protein